ncbi:MAG TPA: hypothetical protein VL285_09050 [Bryobacteraceae bacterium]|jgi:hypothetical protein|nr:hypothetical protein [Bryobacteraceae bacterium]
MSCYISSNANRLYTALESAYGQVPAITAANRIAAIKLATRQELETAERRDKTGSRTFPGFPMGLRRRTSFDLTTYMTSWDNPFSGPPSYDPLFRSSLGGTPLLFLGGTVAAGTQSALTFQSAHGLIPNQAVSHGGEIRFVSAIVDTLTVQLNAPLSVTPLAGAPIGATITYFPATDLPSLSLYDYWLPASAVQRILSGAVVDKMQIELNGDYHQFEFSGPARDLIDSVSFSSGDGQLTSFPAEPDPAPFNYSIIPGHLGQVWLGTGPDRFYTLTSGSVSLDNNLALRVKEFGSSLPRCISPGNRTVLAKFELYEQDDQATKELYQNARLQSPVEVMFQLGQKSGQLFGVRMTSVIPQVPDFDDSDGRLQWKFANSQAQGTLDDEITVAFG